jgi:lysylphosphatidylglycerol synthetase-like protein (DUF2156 family)
VPILKFYSFHGERRRYIRRPCRRLRREGYRVSLQHSLRKPAPIRRARIDATIKVKSMVT